jgi:hypothetical protein
MNFQNRTAVNQQSQKSSETMLYLVPQHVSATENSANEAPAQIIERQEKFLRLNKNIRYKLASYDTGQKIQIIGQKYGLELLRLANITRLIREYYFGEVRFEDFAAEIEKRVGVSLLTAQEITRYIKSEIIDWDPWAEYVAKLPKMSVREMVEKKLKIADTEITSGYVELRGSDELEDPTIKNWIHDYITHLGYGQHSQMQRTQYIFHSENGKNLSSQDREKLGIILKSFDENIPLPVDEENGEIVFEGLVSAQRPTSISNPTTANIPRTQFAHQPSFAKDTAGKQESFIKPYNPASESQRQIPRPTIAPPAPARTTPTLNFAKPNPASTPQPSFVPPSGTTEDKPEEFVHPNLVTQPNKQISPEIDKYFNTPEVPDIPSIKIHSMTEHNEPKAAPQVAPRPIVQQPLPPRLLAREAGQTNTPLHPMPTPRPQRKIIEPFPDRFGEPKTIEPRIDGNIVDLSEK